MEFHEYFSKENLTKLTQINQSNDPFFNEFYDKLDKLRFTVDAHRTIHWPKDSHIKFECHVGKCKNFNKAGLIDPIGTVTHWTAMRGSFENQNRALINPTREVSTHFLTGENQVSQLVGLADKAWHAGIRTKVGPNGEEPHWLGGFPMPDGTRVKDTNGKFFGIDFAHAGVDKANKLIPYTLKELATHFVVLYSLYIEFDMKTENCFGHDQISPKNKIDPGKQYPLELRALLKLTVREHDARS